MLRAAGMCGEGCKHAKDGCTASDVQDNLVLEEMAILVDGVPVRPRANLVFLRRLLAGRCAAGHQGAGTHQHLLVDASTDS